MATPYLRELVKHEVFRFDAVGQVQFYHRASGVPQFRGTLGYIFERFFLAWLSSDNLADVLLCTAQAATAAKTTRSKARPLNPPTAPRTRARSKVDGQPASEAEAAERDLKPVGKNKVKYINGDSDFADAKDSDVPFAMVPMQPNFPTFDVVVCTKREIITVQVTVSSQHTMKEDGFKRLEDNLPLRFQRARKRRHIFVTDCAEKATSLRNQKHPAATRKDHTILIQSAILNI